MASIFLSDAYNLKEELSKLIKPVTQLNFSRENNSMGFVCSYLNFKYLLINFGWQIFTKEVQKTDD